jgi:microcin C transport system permease protein
VAAALMAAYILRRLLILIPTLFGITLLSFLIINLTPGSPVEQAIQAIRYSGQTSTSRSESGVSKEVVDALNKQYGFDRPVLARYGIWLENISSFDFGQSFKFEEPVTELILRKLPVSLTFGLVAFFLTYLICIPLGVMKAIKHGSRFDRATTTFLSMAYSIPPIMLGVLLLVYFAGASHFDWFPLGGVVSDRYNELSFGGKIWDRIHHAILPLTCYMIGGFTYLTFMMKNSVLDVIELDYIRTARAKGVSNFSVFMKHALRNALIPVIAAMSSLLTVFFTGSLLIEKVFNLDGIGLLTLTSVGARDYNVLMGLIFFQSLILLTGRLVTDVLYVAINPRIDFE